ncbi:MAG: S8 family serine peptidase [Polyangiaceae bacterium]
MTKAAVRAGGPAAPEPSALSAAQAVTRRGDRRIRGTDRGVAEQGYLAPAPWGVDAFFAWEVGADGRGQRLIDLERGWTLDHQDLAPHRVEAPRFGTIHDESRGHGTAVLGIACAVEHGPDPPSPIRPNAGCTGIAPAVRAITLVATNPAGDDLAEALAHALNVAEPGDVVLVEAQVTWPTPRGPIHAPVDAVPALYEMVAQAVDRGVVVVEAAGNGAIDRSPREPLDLDRCELPGPGGPFRPFDRSARDSGAIVVSAATAGLPHRRLPWAPFGQRIDAYAWGEDVLAPWSNPGGSTGAYNHRFGGTSAAAAIVAGAALSLQSAYEARRGGRLGGRALRRALLHGGTPAAPGEAPIGVMPNLRAALAALTG